MALNEISLSNIIRTTKVVDFYDCFKFLTNIFFKSNLTQERQLSVGNFCLDFQVIQMIWIEPIKLCTNFENEIKTDIFQPQENTNGLIHIETWPTSLSRCFCTSIYFHLIPKSMPGIILPQHRYITRP